MTQSKDIHIQISTDNQVWFTIKIFYPIDMEPQGLIAIEQAKVLFHLISNTYDLPTHVLWKGTP